jgi:predicted transcriptional regulator
VQKRRNHLGNSEVTAETTKERNPAIRIEEHVRSRLGKYAEFIDSSESYVVSEALKLLFKKDPEFRSWLEHQNHNGDEPENDGGSLFEIAKKA